MPIGTIFVGNLSFFCTEADLRVRFETIGPVHSVIIRRTKAGEMLYYGFVQMKGPNDAKRAVEQLHNQKFLGRKLRVIFSRMDSRSKPLPQEEDTSVQVHVSFLTNQLSNRVDEVLLDRVFGRFGTVADCVVKQYAAAAHPRPRQCGYGYVNFQDLESAKRAIACLSGEYVRDIENMRFDCKLSRDSEHLLQESVATPSSTISEDGHSWKRFSEASSESYPQYLGSIDTVSKDSADAISLRNSESSAAPIHVHRHHSPPAMLPLPVNIMPPPMLPPLMMPQPMMYAQVHHQQQSPIQQQPPYAPQHGQMVIAPSIHFAPPTSVPQQVQYANMMPLSMPQPGYTYAPPLPPPLVPMVNVPQQSAAVYYQSSHPAQQLQQPQLQLQQQSMHAPAPSPAPLYSSAQMVYQPTFTNHPHNIYVQ